jgi:hypothetical protein
MKIVSLLTGFALAATLGAQTCSFTKFGRPCGGDLAGSQVRTTAGSAVRFDASNLAPGAIAIMVMGQAGRPIRLPGSNCGLLVQPRDTQIGTADRFGDASFRFQLPTTLPAQADFQVVTIGFDRNGRTAESTNGVHLVVR